MTIPLTYVAKILRITSFVPYTKIELTATHIPVMVIAFPIST